MIGLYLFIIYWGGKLMRFVITCIGVGLAVAVILAGYALAIAGGLAAGYYMDTGAMWVGAVMVGVALVWLGVLMYRREKEEK